MRFVGHYVAALLVVIFISALALAADESQSSPAETKLDGPVGLSIVVRMQGPYDADVPLQVVCYFKRTATSDAKFSGAPVELNKRLGGLIESLRARGEFAGDELETFLIDPTPGTINPKRLLLIGLGDDSTLSLGLMEKVGRIALREAARLGATKVAFAPLIKDAGNSALPAGDVGSAVIHGMLLAYDTEQRLQKEQFALPFKLETWIMEAGPTYYNETITAVKTSIIRASDSVKSRPSLPYSSKKN